MASSDGHLLAYQTDGELNTAKTVQVMDLADGSSYQVEARKGEAIRPLGFIKMISYADMCGRVILEKQLWAKK